MVIPSGYVYLGGVLRGYSGTGFAVFSATPVLVAGVGVVNVMPNSLRICSLSSLSETYA